MSEVTEQEIVTVDFFTFSKRYNSTKRLPEGATGTNTKCLLKSPTSIINPTIVVKGAYDSFGTDAFLFNYCYIEEFKRYYFVRNPIALGQFRWSINLEIDVLATWKPYILNTNAFVEYANGSSNIADSRNPLEATAHQESIPITGINIDYKGSYYLRVVNNVTSGSFFVTYEITPTQLSALARYMLNPSITEYLKQLFNDPMDCIAELYWLPFSASNYGNTISTSVYLGDMDSGVTANAIAMNSLQYTNSTRIEFFIPYPDDIHDCRNYSPYVTRSVYFPFAGRKDFPSDIDMESPTAMLWYGIDFEAGTVSYMIPEYRLSANADIKVPIPISRETTGLKQNIGGISSLYGLTVAALSLSSGIMPLVYAGIGLGVAGLSSSMAPNNYTTNGTQGSLALSSVEHQFGAETITTYKKPLNDSMGFLGNPIFKIAKLGNYSGFVQCSYGYVDCPCTEEEHRKITSFINKEYGGIFIE